MLLSECRQPPNDQVHRRGASPLDVERTSVAPRPVQPLVRPHKSPRPAPPTRRAPPPTRPNTRGHRRRLFPDDRTARHRCPPTLPCPLHPVPRLRPTLWPKSMPCLARTARHPPAGVSSPTTDAVAPERRDGLP